MHYQQKQQNNHADLKQIQKKKHGNNSPSYWFQIISAAGQHRAPRFLKNTHLVPLD